ncbi:MAG TPA: hypothetical protein VFH15_08530 [Pyrinomonadaceae bacterium]|nr:hypothetical protein [Pyrinomonadaceae bacterium]
MKIPVLILLMLGIVSFDVKAQRPRAVDNTPTKATAAKVAPAPQTVKVKYEGGVFGYRKTMEGTLTFDDTNNRLLFKNKAQKEMFFIPYNAVTSAFADTQKRRPAAATVASAIPLIYALPAQFIKTKVRYLTLNFYDPDTHVSGITSFRMENKEILASVLQSLAEKADMVARGEVYVRQRPLDPTKTNP